MLLGSRSGTLSDVCSDCAFPLVPWSYHGESIRYLKYFLISHDLWMCATVGAEMGDAAASFYSKMKAFVCI